MSAPWWHPGEVPRPTGLLAHLRPPAEDVALPATLLYLPPAQPEAVGVQALTDRISTPGSRREDGMTLHPPEMQCGMVKSWRAQSVDLRRLLFPPPAAPTQGDGNFNGEGEDQAIAAMTSLARAKRDALARRLVVILQPPVNILLHSGGPLAWAEPLYPFQCDGIRTLLHSPQLLLADDMGLGKTVQAIAALRLLLFRRDITRALIVTPASLLEQWHRELTRWAPELRVMCLRGSPQTRRWQWAYRTHVTLCSYETLRADFTGSFHSGPCREEWGVVVLDEAQRIKNAGVDLARICKQLPRQRSWALTGTPLENRLEDVVSILEFVTGGPVPMLTPALRSTLSRFQLRRRKADVLPDLPPKIVTDLVLPLTPAQRRHYDRAEQEGIIALHEIGEVRVEHILALITRLKQLCNFSPAGESAKMEDLDGRLQELVAEGHKALIFTQYLGDESGARRIASRLRRFSPLLYTGELTPSERTEVVDRFQQGDHPMLILSLRAGGLGLNLQCASYVFHFDRWWNPAVELQAEDRTHRLGQELPVNVYRYVMADTIEQRIDDLLRRKSALFTHLVDTTSLDPASLLDKADLFNLFDLG